MPYTPTYTYSGTTSALDLSRSFFGDINYVANSNEEMILSDQEYANFQTVYSGLTVDYGVACLTAILNRVQQNPEKYKAGSGDAEADWTARLKQWRSTKFELQHGLVQMPVA
jgi:hypothetical protein